MRRPDKRSASGASRPTLGFGVPATSDPHHFKVVVPRSNTDKVQISEYLGLQASSDEYAIIDRLLLERPRWTAIRAEVQRAFNTRLKAHGLKTSAWKVGENSVDRLLGKELCVLAWAVERMALEKIPVTVRNWLALRPEERWWLFGMTAMTTGGIADSDTGWRCATPWATSPRANCCSRAPDGKKPMMPGCPHWICSMELTEWATGRVVLCLIRPSMRPNVGRISAAHPAMTDQME